MDDLFYAVGAVVIGRNEGERLVACLHSLSQLGQQIVYVDSGSTDASITNAHSCNATVVALDLSKPFTAARARNTGAARLLALYPHLKYIQFVDGDCAVDINWLINAQAFLDKNSHIAVASGRRRERFPENSIYNMQCNHEWDTPTGEAKACGGDCLIRVEAFNTVSGYRECLIAGEEPEMCLRLRKLGWKIWRLDVEMTLHDANILHFKQWWKRNQRSGYAYAQGAYLHGKTPEKHWVKETMRAAIWGVLLPLIIIITTIFKVYYAVLLVALYALQWVRIAYKNRALPNSYQIATLLVISKFAEGLGLMMFWKNQLLGQRGALIEYK